MKKDNIVQFVCFQTDVNIDTFIVAWEQYAKSLGNTLDVVLHQQSVKSKFKYVSRHTSSRDDFRFVFVKGRKPEHFNDCNVKVMQAGGYTPFQIECTHEANNNETKILVFCSGIVDISTYKKLHSYKHLNIYEAYFESSSYSYIMEFFVEKGDADNLLLQLKEFDNGNEIGIYKECVLQEL